MGDAQKCDNEAREVNGGRVDVLSERDVSNFYSDTRGADAG